MGSGKIIQARPGLLERDVVVSDKGLDEERDVLVQSTGSDKVNPAQIETRRSHYRFKLTAGSVSWNHVDRLPIIALPVPDWSGAKHDWPIGRILVNRCVPAIAQLISVVLKGLAKIV